MARAGRPGLDRGERPKPRCADATDVTGRAAAVRQRGESELRVTVLLVRGAIECPDGGARDLSRLERVL
jgi:hypothetical protein